MNAQEPNSQLELWSASLDFLAEEISVGVESMARRLSLVLTDDAPLAVGLAEPNGYAGLSRRGDFGRLLLSDWSLAHNEPDEFFRRVVSSELSFLELSYQEPKPPGGMVVLLDGGPDQLGGPRLVQLAAIAVLERMARGSGVPIRIGVLGDKATVWHTGLLPELFSGWLQARRSEPPSQADFDDRISELPEDSVVWLLGGADISTDSLSASCRQLIASELDWGPEGLTGLRVRVGSRSVDVELPEKSASLRLLRGHGIRRRQRNFDGDSDLLRYPSFHSSVRTLLCRGDVDNVLVVVPIPKTSSNDHGRIKRRQFGGPVLAASLVGQRTVAAVAIGGSLRVVVIGKHLAKVDQIEVPLNELGIHESDVAEICASGLAPLHFSSGSIVLKVLGEWWSLEPGSPAQTLEVDYVVASSTPDQPRFLTKDEAWRWVHMDWMQMPEISSDTRVLLGGNNSIAIEQQRGEWVFADSDSPHPVKVDGTVFGLVCTSGGPGLLVLSREGHILRLVRSAGQKTLTRFSTDVASAVVHPTLPIVAIHRTNGWIDVVDLEEVDLLRNVRGAP